MAFGAMLAPQAAAGGMQSAIAQALSPQAVASGGQGGAGFAALMQGLQNNPAAIQALLRASSRLLNPTTFNSPGGRIASAVSQGFDEYSGQKAASAQQAKENQLAERKVAQGDRQLDQSAEKMDQENKQFQQKFGLSEDELKAKKALWEAQARKYGAEAKKLRDGKADLSKLTGEERQVNKIAEIIAAQGVPEDKAYLTALDIYKGSNGDAAKARAKIYETMGFMASRPEGAAALDNIIEGVVGSFSTSVEQAQQAADQYGNPAGSDVTPDDINQAMQAISQNEGRTVTWEELNPQQQARLKEQIRKTKQGAQ